MSHLSILLRLKSCSCWQVRAPWLGIVNLISRSPHCLEHCLPLIVEMTVSERICNNLTLWRIECFGHSNRRKSPLMHSTECVTWLPYHCSSCTRQRNGYSPLCLHNYILQYSSTLSRTMDLEYIISSRVPCKFTFIQPTVKSAQLLWYWNTDQVPVLSSYSSFPSQSS